MAEILVKITMAEIEFFIKIRYNSGESRRRRPMSIKER
jgi:hypothetical protein